MGIHFGPDAERDWQADQLRLDQDVKDRFRVPNIESEITHRRGASDVDTVRRRMGGLLVKAWGTLYHAVRNGYGYSDVCDLADKALKLRLSCADAPSLRADALALRAAAKARMGLFPQAAEDAAAAVALDADAGLWYDVPARRLLKVLKRFVRV
jgi:hypothetical protein